MKTYILDLLLILSSATMILVSLGVLFGYRPKKNKVPFIIATAVTAVATAIEFYLLRNNENRDFGLSLIQLAANMGLPYFLYKSGKKSTLALYGFVMPAFADIFAALLSSKIGYDNDDIMSVAYICIYVLMTATAFIMHKVLPIKFKPDFLDTIPVYVYIIIFIYLLSNYYTLELAYDTSYFAGVANMLKVVSAILVVASVVIIVIRYINALNLQKEAEKQIEAEIHHYEDMMKKNSDIRSFRHDYQNNLFSLNALMSEGKIDEAKEYLSGLSGDLQGTANKYQTGNHLADAIISEKAEEASKTGTEIDFSGTIPCEWISNRDLCVIISNTLDNAVRACEPIENATIRINAKETDNSFVMTVINPVEKKIEIKNNRIKTSKTDSANHGIGLTNIEKTAKKYDGYMKLSCSDNEFETVIGLIRKQII